MSSDTDDIDAGWDEDRSATGPEAVERQAARGLSEPPAAVSALSALNEPRAGSSHSLTPAEVGTRSSVRPARTGGRSVLPISVFFVLAAGTLLWVRREPKVGERSSPVVANVAEPRAAHALPATEIPLQLSVPQAPLPTAAPAAPSARTETPGSPAEAGSIEPLVLYAPETSNVTVTSTPSGAVFFESGTRLGSGQVTVRVTSKSKRYLTALLGGYAPLNFRIDGSKPSVTVKLTPVQAASAPGSEPAVPSESPSPPAPASD